MSASRRSDLTQPFIPPKSVPLTGVDYSSLEIRALASMLTDRVVLPRVLSRHARNAFFNAYTETSSIQKAFDALVKHYAEGGE